MLTLSKLRGPGYFIKVYFLILHMCIYGCINFQVSSIILTSFRQEIGGERGGVGKRTPQNEPPQSEPPKTSTYIRAKLHTYLNLRPSQYSSSVLSHLETLEPTCILLRYMQETIKEHFWSL